MKGAAAVTLAAVAMSAPGCGLAQQPSPAGFDDTLKVPVTDVVDGDTIEVIFEGRTERLRLIGLDAPESVRPDHPIECFGTASARFTRRNLEGTQVRLEFDEDRRDRFGRLLAYVFQRDELFNETLVAEGFAIEQPYPPNLAHQDELRRAETEARRKRLGLWGACKG